MCFPLYIKETPHPVPTSSKTLGLCCKTACVDLTKHVGSGSAGQTEESEKSVTCGVGRKGLRALAGCLQALPPENEGQVYHSHHLHGSWGECQMALQ